MIIYDMIYDDILKWELKVECYLQLPIKLIKSNGEYKNCVNTMNVDYVSGRVEDIKTSIGYIRLIYNEVQHMMSIFKSMNF